MDGNNEININTHLDQVPKPRYELCQKVYTVSCDGVREHIVTGVKMILAGWHYFQGWQYSLSEIIHEPQETKVYGSEKEAYRVLSMKLSEALDKSQPETQPETLE